MFKLRRGSAPGPKAEPTRAEVTERMRKSCEHVRGWFMLGGVLCIVRLFLCASTVNYCLHEAAATCGDDWWLALWTVVEGVAGSTSSGGDTWGNAMTVIVTLGISSTLMLAICAEGTRCFKAIVVAGTPFTPDAVKHMKAIKWLVIALVLYPLVLALPVNLLCPPNGGLAQFATNQSHMVGALDVIVFLVGIAALINVLEYGCVLQRQDDEMI